MMDNTLENKAKFFAQYWGQECFYSGRTEQKEPYKTMPFGMLEKYKDEAYLELTPLSQITDEDAIEVARIMGILNGKVTRYPGGVTVTDKEGKYITLEDDFDNCGYDNGASQEDAYSCTLSLESCDYLRSKRYALPWMGLSVEEQINRGWTKLKEAE